MLWGASLNRRQSALHLYLNQIIPKHTLTQLHMILNHLASSLYMYHFGLAKIFTIFQPKMNFSNLNLKFDFVVYIAPVFNFTTVVVSM